MFEALTQYLTVFQDSAGEPVDAYYHAIPELKAAIQATADANPDLKLNRYGEILANNGIKWEYSSMCRANASKLDGQGVMALLMGALRAERFREGVLLDFLKDGVLQKWLNRLQELDRQ